MFNPDYRRTLWPMVQLQVRTFVAMARRFDETYGLLKSQIHGLDFADLEHQALRLLTEPSPSPAARDGQREPKQPSQTALALRSRYQYLFVDEYQDINPVQQAILNRLRSRGNIFGVGDVKQSIYAFRGAEPTIFLDCLRPASSDLTQDKQGFRVDLTVNFRSSPGILDFVNALFSRIMTEPCAGLDYDESARLVPPSASEILAGPAVELHVLDELEDPDHLQSDEGHDPRRVSNRERQAALIAQRIQQMVGTATGQAEFQIRDPDTDAWRDVQFRDIVVLLRSPSGRDQDYERILRRAGVPVTSPSIGFFEAIEVQDCLNLLKVLDNPHRDIEMAAVLRSPMFGVTDTEMAKIRLFFRGPGRRESFYEAFRAYAQGGPDKVLADRLRAVHDRLRSCANGPGSVRWRR